MYNPPSDESAAAADARKLEAGLKLQTLLDASWTAPTATSPSLLAIGILTMPVLVRSPLLRRYNRAVHYAQRPVRTNVVGLRYIVSTQELARLTVEQAAGFRAENATYRDLLEVPPVPSGRLTRALRDAAHPPEGAGCMLKILGWLQLATNTMPSTPFVAYGDDDTFWALTRMSESLMWLRPGRAGLADLPHRVHMYIGAMQYHQFWDFRIMKSSGWHWSLPVAAKEFAHRYNQSESNWPYATAKTLNLTAPFQKPYPMAHGLGVVLSASLARHMPRARAVGDFLTLYERWLRETDLGARELASIRASHKCRLGTDSTFGAWVAALHVPVMAVDLLNFNQNWPWPLPQRCHGDNADAELLNLHALHLYGPSAKDATFWWHLHNQTALTHEAAGVDEPDGAGGTPRLRCRHADDARVAKGILDLLLEHNASLKQAPHRWLGAQPTFPDERRLDQRDWLYCGLTCKPSGVRCQREWVDLRRRLRRF